MLERGVCEIAPPAAPLRELRVGVPKTWTRLSRLPPRRGGIQTFVDEILRRLDPDSFSVFGPAESGSAAFDAAAGYEIHRYGGSVIPTPRVAKAVAAVAAATGAQLPRDAAS